VKKELSFFALCPLKEEYGKWDYGVGAKKVSEFISVYLCSANKVSVSALFLEPVLNVVRFSNSKMDVTEPHPLPTPPSNPPDASDRDIQQSGRGGDPLAASPDLSHPAVVDAFTSDVRDEPPSPSALSSPLAPPVPSTNNPHPDSLIDFERSRSEPAEAMQVDEHPTPPATGGLVNGHKETGEYTAVDVFSGPAVESPEATNEPTQPSTERPVSGPAASSSLLLPPSMVSGVVEQAPSVVAVAFPTQPPQRSKLPLVQLGEQIVPPAMHPLRAPMSADQRPKSKTPTPPSASVNADTPMEDVKPSSSITSTAKPIRGAPTSSDEPPAKRLKTEPSAPAPIYDTSKKIPANQHRFLTALLRQIRRSKDSMPFREPVDPVKLNIPQYLNIITRPMDLSTIDKKLATGVYPVVQAVIDDFHLMIDNCVKFNGPENSVTQMGRNMQATFEKGMKTLPQEQVPKQQRSTVVNDQAPPPPKPVVAPQPPPAQPPAPTPVAAPPPKPKTPTSAPPLPRRPSGAAFPPIRRESLTADGRPKREIKPPPERDIPMDKPRPGKKHAAELRFCQTVVKELQKKVHEKYSFPFLAPVDTVALKIPDYYDIIEKAMDVQTLDNNLKAQKYATADEFYKETKLIFSNCYKYNGANAPVSLLAKQFEKVFDKKWTEKPEEPPEKPEKPAKRPASSSPPRQEEEDESEEDEIGLIQMQMAAMAERLTEITRKKQQRRQERSPTVKGKGSKGGSKKSGGGGSAATTQRSTSGASSKPKKSKEVPIPEVTFEQKRELSEKINFLSPSKLQGVLEIIKDAMPLDSVATYDITEDELTGQAQEEIELDIDVLQPQTLYALYMYVVKDTKVSTASAKAKAAAKPKKKREVLTADAQNKKIAELEGMLDNYDKKSIDLLDDPWLTNEEKPQVESESEEESDDAVSSDDSD
jgi:bromodomain-containing factor 1